MILLRIKSADASALKKVAKQLRAGAVVVYPTDTAYALGCDATNAKAVAKIFQIKSRAANKALPVICADLKMVKKYFRIVHCPLSIVHKKWPAPLSIVLKAKKGIAKAVLRQGTAAVRVPNSDIARDLSKYLGRPLVATSANLSGQPACYSVRAVLRQFGFVVPSHQTRDLKVSNSAMGFLALTKTTVQARNDNKTAIRTEPDMVLNAGALPHRRPSTIVRSAKSGTIEVLRKGPVVIPSHQTRDLNVSN